MYKGTSPNLTAITSSSSQHSSVPESEREFRNEVYGSFILYGILYRRLNQADHYHTHATDHQGAEEAQWRNTTARSQVAKNDNKQFLPWYNQ